MAQQIAFLSLSLSAIQPECRQLRFKLLLRGESNPVIAYATCSSLSSCILTTFCRKISTSAREIKQIRRRPVNLQISTKQNPISSPIGRLKARVLLSLSLYLARLSLPAGGQILTKLATSSSSHNWRPKQKPARQNRRSV